MSNDQKKKIIHSPGFTTDTEVCELCLRKKHLRGFLLYNCETNNLSFEANLKSISDDGKEIEIRPMKQSFWPLIQFSQEQEGPLPKIDPEMVFNQVKSYIYDSVELPYELLYDILTLWTMSTYLIEKFDAVSYLAFIGPKNSGKTRALEVIAELSYRGLLSPSCSSASLFRLVEKCSPTLCLDEAEIYGSEQKSEAIAILNAGYRKGQYVYRVNKDTGELEGFSVFGHKSLASTDIFIPTIESRAIIVHMRRNVRNLPVFLDKERAANLRFSLLVYRINVLAKKTSILENKDEILRYLPVKNGRLAELFYLLISVAPTEEIRKRVSEFAIEVGNKRQEEEKLTIAAELVEAVVSCRDRVQNGKLMVENILEAFNSGKDESLRLDSRSMGRELRKLGFDPTRVSGGRHAVFYNENLVNNLSQRFLSREMSQTSLTSLMSQGASNNEGDVSDNSDDSDNSKRKKLTINNLNLVHAADEDSEEKECAICSNKSKKSWVAMTNKGQIVYICENCAEDFKNQTSKH